MIECVYVRVRECVSEGQSGRRCAPGVVCTRKRAGRGGVVEVVEVCVGARGGRDSPVHGAVGPLRSSCLGAARFQLSGHAHVCQRDGRTKAVKQRETLSSAQHSTAQHSTAQHRGKEEEEEEEEEESSLK